MMRRLPVWILAPLLAVAAADKKPKRPEPPVVELLEAAVHRTTEATVEIDGRVRNVVDKPLQKLVLIFDVEAPGGEVVARMRGPLEEEALEPGEEAEFHWRMRDPARGVRIRVSASDRRGFELPVKNPGPYPIE